MPEILEVNDILPRFQLINHRGKGSDLFRHAMGQPIVVLLLPSGDENCASLLESVVARGKDLEEKAHVLAFSDRTPSASAELAERLGFPFPILFDDQGLFAQSFGHLERNDDGTHRYKDSMAILVADPNRRLAHIDRDPARSNFTQRLFEYLNALESQQPLMARAQAPILFVPRVLDRNQCKWLIDLHKSNGNSPSGVFRTNMREPGGVIDHSMKVRRDHIVTEPEVALELKRLLGKRLVPEIFKAFSFRARYVKEFKIGCYDSAESGFFNRHRDNYAEVGGRRFAVTLNLNAEDYEGGELRFPEYGSALYKPETGEAVVFSCYHVHEVLPVTTGRRYTLLCFLYGDDGDGPVRSTG